MVSPTDKKEIQALYAAASTGLLDTVKQIAAKAEKNGLTPADVAMAVNKAYDQKVKPLLEKNFDLKAPQANQAEPEQTRKLGNK